MNTYNNDEVFGYLPLAKLIQEIKKHKSMKGGIYSFIRNQKCLLEGKKNLDKLRKIFKNHSIRKSKKNHIFVLDTDVYLVFANRDDYKIYYIYNEFYFDITANHLQAQALNYNKCFHAFSFLNSQIDIIQDYFTNMFQYNLKDDYIGTLCKQQNLIHNEIKKFISPHSFKTIKTSAYHKLMSDTFSPINNYVLENYMEKSTHNIIFEDSDSCYFEIFIEIDNGTFSLSYKYNCFSDTDRVTESKFLAENGKLKIFTKYSPIDWIIESQKYDILIIEKYKKIFSKYNVKEFLREYFKQS